MEAKGNSPDARARIVTGAAATLLAVTVGQRSALGIFMSPLNPFTGLGLATISLAMATVPLRVSTADRCCVGPSQVGPLRSRREFDPFV
jgi:hypothetical protein